MAASGPGAWAARSRRGVVGVMSRFARRAGQARCDSDEVRELVGVADDAHRADQPVLNVDREHLQDAAVRAAQHLAGAGR